MSRTPALTVFLRSIGRPASRLSACHGPPGSSPALGTGPPHSLRTDAEAAAGPGSPERKNPAKGARRRAGPGSNTWWTRQVRRGPRLIVPARITATHVRLECSHRLAVQAVRAAPTAATKSPMRPRAVRRQNPTWLAWVRFADPCPNPELGSKEPVFSQRSPGRLERFESAQAGQVAGVGFWEGYRSIAQSNHGATKAARAWHSRTTWRRSAVERASRVCRPVTRPPPRRH